MFFLHHHYLISPDKEDIQFRAERIRGLTAEQPSLIATTTSLLPGLSSVSPENSSALSDIEPVDPTDTDDVSKKSKSSSKRVKRCDPVKIRVVR